MRVSSVRGVKAQKSQLQIFCAAIVPFRVMRVQRITQVKVHSKREEARQVMCIDPCAQI